MTRRFVPQCTPCDACGGPTTWSGHSGGYGRAYRLVFHCQDESCKARRTERGATVSERRRLARYERRQTTRTRTQNALWWAIIKKFRPDGREWLHGGGADLQDALDAFAKKHRSIAIAHCDDAAFMNSYVYMVPHETRDYYWGTSCLLVTQDAQPPAEFFLYPSDVDGLIAILKKIQARQKAKRRELVI